MRWTLAALVAVTMMVLAATQITIFVLQPIGAVPEGATLILWRREGTRFIDSADAMCLRVQDGVSLLCRMMILGGIAKGGEAMVRLPYSETLYLLSTGGQTFER